MRQYEKLVETSLGKISEMDLLSQNEILNHINTTNSQVVKSIYYHGADEDKALVIKELKFHEFKKIKKQESKLYTKQQILDVI